MRSESAEHARRNSLVGCGRPRSAATRVPRISRQTRTSIRRRTEGERHPRRSPLLIAALRSRSATSLPERRRARRPTPEDATRSPRRRVALERPPPLGRVVDDRRRIVARRSRSRPPAARRRSSSTARRAARQRHVAQLRAPSGARTRRPGRSAPAGASGCTCGGSTARVDADRRDPLPVAVVLRLVAVEQQPHEVRLARAPVEVQVLGQERADDQPRAVVHPAASRAAGASRRRRSGSRCGPRCQASRRSVVVVPTRARRDSAPGARGARCRGGGGARGRRSRASASWRTNACAPGRRAARALPRARARERQPKCR